MLGQQPEEGILRCDRNARRDIVQQFLSFFPLADIECHAYDSVRLSLAIVNSFALVSYPD